MPKLPKVFVPLHMSPTNIIADLQEHLQQDTCHTIKLLDSSKLNCGILSYFGSASYVYQRMPMGLSTSPAVWQSYINAIPSNIPTHQIYNNYV